MAMAGHPVVVGVSRPASHAAMGGGGGGGTGRSVASAAAAAAARRPESAERPTRGGGDAAAATAASDARYQDMLAASRARREAAAIVAETRARSSPVKASAPPRRMPAAVAPTPTSAGLRTATATATNRLEARERGWNSPSVAPARSRARASIGGVGEGAIRSGSAAAPAPARPAAAARASSSSSTLSSTAAGSRPAVGNAQTTEQTAADKDAVARLDYRSPASPPKDPSPRKPPPTSPPTSIGSSAAAAAAHAAAIDAAKRYREQAMICSGVQKYVDPDPRAVTWAPSPGRLARPPVAARIASASASGGGTRRTSAAEIARERRMDPSSEFDPYGYDDEDDEEEDETFKKIATSGAKATRGRDARASKSAAPSRPLFAARPAPAAAPAVPAAADHPTEHPSRRVQSASATKNRNSASWAAGGATRALPVMDLGDVNDGGQLPGYLLGAVVGEGGFCKVRAGIHQVTGAKTAVKLIDKTKLTDVNDRKRVGREIRVLKRLTHESIIRLFDVVDGRDKMFVVMEYADGGSLLDHVRARKRLSERESARMFRQMCAGLMYCHANGVVHRDVKLENVLLDANANVKIIDFGLSAVLTPGRRLRGARFLTPVPTRPRSRGARRSLTTSPARGALRPPLDGFNPDTPR